MRNDGTLNSSGPLTGFKRSMYEGGIRVPWIVRWPGRIQGGQVSDLPVYFPDLMPAFADLAGATNNLPKVDGLSIVPTLLGKGKQPRHEFMYWEWGSAGRAVRHGNWKLVSKEAQWELYDLKSHIGEKENLASQHPEIVEMVAAWVKENRTEPPQLTEPIGEDGKKYRTPAIAVTAD
jgi:arylsulfatase A-like enzyme